mmetsp:Transcript_7261/g.20651  ORF Transcript_7261/g.20651 Transcript_7261/m.20651 type:complete len:212 (+) Transcript_7261:759-1394(+)
MLVWRIRRNRRISFCNASADMDCLPTTSLQTLMATSELCINLAFRTSPNPPPFVRPASNFKCSGRTTQCSAMPRVMTSTKLPDTNNADESFADASVSSPAITASAAAGAGPSTWGRRRRSRQHATAAATPQMAAPPTPQATATVNISPSSSAASMAEVNVVPVVEVDVGGKTHCSPSTRVSTRRLRAAMLAEKGSSSANPGDQHAGQEHVL